MGDKKQDSVERPADGNKNQTSDSLQQVTAPGNSKGRKKRGKKKRSAKKMEDKEGEMDKFAPLQSVLVQSQSVESSPAQSPSVQADPPLGQSNREKPTPEQPIPEQPKPETPKPAQRNPAQPLTGHQNPATPPSALPNQAQPEQPNPVHPNLSQPPLDHLSLTQSKDQPTEAQPHPDQGPPTRLSTDQSSPQQSSPDQADPSSPHQSSPDQSSPNQSSPDQSSPQQSSPDHPDLSSPHLSSPDPSFPHQSSPDPSSPHQSSPDQSSPNQSSPDQSSPQQSSPQQLLPKHPDQSSQSSPDEDKPKKKGDPNKLSLLTWNIDGLDLNDIKERLSRLLDYLIKYHPDIVLLQEVISPIYQVLQQVLKPYHVLPGSDRSYFTAILLRKSRVQLLESSIVNYPTTEMRRNLLMAHVSFLGHPLCVMTSHMESMKPQSLERQNQLRTVWKTMREQPQDHSVIFGGDTNLRDWEVKNQGGLPENICDVWESLGQPEDCRYTWDCVTNDNKDLPFPARLRFDRIFLRQAGEGSKVSPDGITLVGLERLNDCQRFTSDHWGLLCTFVIKPLSQATPE
ncbi:tyrosyl-DNA phosphodiesterase 2-like [Oncorhynchus nerka]|uniref:tyrosyl-DNA phosphodiesterase 2-like n=1 Tax=Oncorhynchus nerka TaxID=8023 RepID=UPI001131D110|nr:tyrosyl-DNA phosphodiesterase 2-like [Oncorhynchus nerka]